MPRLPWFVAEDWGGGYSIRARDGQGEWIIATAREKTQALLMVEAVNNSGAGLTPPADWQARAGGPWIIKRDAADRFAVRRAGDDQAAWPIARFNHREDVSLLIGVVRRLREGGQVA